MTDLKNIQPLTNYNLLLIGDSCTDLYKVGTVDRISPEAPVPIIKIIEEFSVPGMSANVKNNLYSLGIDCDHITNGQEIVKTRFIDKRSGQHILRVDQEPNIVPWTGRVWFNYAELDCVIISDYNKGFLNYEAIETIIENASCPIFIDTKKTDLKRFSADNVFVKINETENKNKISDPTHLIVTLGERGAWYTNSQIEMQIPTKSVDVVDVCGAGDTFLAALAVQYLYTKDIKQAIIFANMAAGLTVQHRGNYAPTYNEIMNA